jgi:Mn-containing catalase
MSNGSDIRGPWNEGMSTKLGETWQYIDDPIRHVVETQGLTNIQPTGTNVTMDAADKKTREISKMKSEEIKSAVPKGENQWSTYPEKV